MRFKVPAAAVLITLVGAVTSSGQSAGRMPASGIQVASQAPSAADGSAKRNYVFARGDGISVEVPVGWQDNHRQGQPFPIIAFFPPPGGQDFQVLLSPRWRNGRPGPSYRLLRQMVEAMPEKVRPRSIESDFPLQPVESRTVLGFYYSASAPNTQPGEYRFLTQGAFKAGPIMVAFTILTGDGQEQVVEQALRLIGSAQYKIPVTSTPKGQPGARTKNATTDPEWPLAVDLPGFEGDPDARNRTAPMPPTAPDEESPPDSVPGPANEPQSVNPDAPFPVVFELEKKGHVLRIRWVRKERRKTQAIAVAIQLAETIEKEQQFDLDLTVDGTIEGKKRFKAGQPIALEARGTPQPYQIRITEVGKDSIGGEIVPSSPVGRIEFDFYTAEGRLTGKSPQLLWVSQPSASEAAATSAQDSASAGTDVYNAGGGIIDPVLLKRSLPKYTDAAVKCKIRGTVLLGIVVREDGSIDQIRILKSLGYWGLDEAAVEDVANKWRFRPGTLNGQRVSVRATVEVTFSL